MQTQTQSLTISARNHSPRVESFKLWSWDCWSLGTFLRVAWNIFTEFISGWFQKKISIFCSSTQSLSLLPPNPKFFFSLSVQLIGRTPVLQQASLFSLKYVLPKSLVPFSEDVAVVVRFLFQSVGPPLAWQHFLPQPLSTAGSPAAFPTYAADKWPKLANQCDHCCGRAAMWPVRTFWAGLHGDWVEESQVLRTHQGWGCGDHLCHPPGKSTPRGRPSHQGWRASWWHPLSLRTWPCLSPLSLDFQF